MRKFLIAGALALSVMSLGGCAGTLQKIEAGFTVATGNVITPQQVYIAMNAFDAIEATATNYLRLPRCPKAVACRNSSTSAAIATWVRAGRADRNRLKAGLRANPGQSISLVDVYNDLQNITSQLGSLVGH